MVKKNLTILSKLRTAFIPAAGLLASTGLAGSPVKDLPPAGSVVRIERMQGSKWCLLRDGEVYPVRGAGGQVELELLVELGGNSIRTWGGSHLEERVDGRELLERAHELGLTVSAGIWIEHPRHGFDYTNERQVEAQREKVRQLVRRYKDHPALLLWGLGNEVEMQRPEEEYPLIFGELNELARIIKEEDPHHPVMTAIVNAPHEKIRAIIVHYPELDILGINAYGAARVIPDHLRKAGWNKPYLLTEFGPHGPWERPKTAWGVAIEPTPLEKMEMIRTAYKVNAASPQCLGSYAFLWGAKQEYTATWFGLLLPSGEKTPPVDILSYKWTGQWPKNRSPVIASVETDFVQRKIAPGSQMPLSIHATDPDGDPLRYDAWVMTEAEEKRKGGDVERIPLRVAGCFVPSSDANFSFTAPEQQGNYRAFIKASDGKGGACVYSFPFKVQ